MYLLYQVSQYAQDAQHETWKLAAAFGAVAFMILIAGIVIGFGAKRSDNRKGNS